MRCLRVVPWLLVALGMGIPLSQTPSLWPFVVGWAIVIGIAWLVGRAILVTRLHRMSAALTLLPVLVVPLAFWGGWWLIPADLAWLVVEALDRDAEQRSTESVT